jgi:ABC-type antimicrobial peptide transport system permease subunit
LSKAGTGAGVVGETIGLANGSYRLLGIVGDTKYRGPQNPFDDVVYLPFASAPPSSFSVIVRTLESPESAFPAVRTAVHEADPDLPIESLQTLDDRRAEMLAPQRFRFAVIGLFGGVALLLTTIGLYGVIAQSVTERTREIGVRVALGAVPRRIVVMVLGEAVLLAGLGVGFGTLAAAGASRVLASVLVGVTVFDRTSYATVAVGLLAVAVLAGFLPARRASRLDPVHALRVE